jgi:hypothetical protein
MPQTAVNLHWLGHCSSVDYQTNKYWLKTARTDEMPLLLHWQRLLTVQTTTARLDHLGISVAYETPF